MFRRGIGTGQGGPLSAGLGSHVDDPTAALLHHDWQDRLRTEKHPLGVHRHDPVPSLFFHVENGHDGQDTYIVDQDIDPVPCLDGPGYHVLGLGLIGHIHLDGHGLPTGFLDE